MAQSLPPAFESKTAVTPEQLHALQRELAELRQAVAQSVDAMPNEPFYECIEPYYSSDDVYYPAGARFVDLTGMMIPNENMIPLNAAAEAHMIAYLGSLPHAQRTPTVDNIVEATMKVRPRHGDDPALLAQMQARMLQEAFEIQYGVGPDKLEAAKPRLPPRPKGNIPLMPNTHIVGTDAFRPPSARTRFVADAIAPAHKTTRVMGSVQSNPLGTEQAGVSAQ